MDEGEYVKTVCDFLEYLPQTTTIHRLAGNGLSTELIAPKWLSKNLIVLIKLITNLLTEIHTKGVNLFTKNK